VDQPILKSSLSIAFSRLVNLFQEDPFCRVEGLRVRAGEPDFTHPPRVIRKLKMGADNAARPEAALPDFWLKKQVVELLGTISELGDGEIRSIEVAHGLPLTVEIERRPVVDGEPTRA